MAGFVYGIFAGYMRLAILCPVNTVTGLKCPGCGVTHMCIALMQLDFRGAFLCHPMLFLMLILLGAVFMGSAVTYVKDGAWKPKSWQNIIRHISIVLPVCYGVVRNLI